MRRNGELEPGRPPIAGRIAGGLWLLCGLAAAVALDWEPRGTLNLAIYHHVGTAYHEMWSTDVAWPRGSRHTIRFEAVGDWLSVYWDHERRGEVQATARANDPAPYTGPGRAGLRHYGDDEGWVTRFDSFRWQAGFN
jgi:hypothetical protein